MLELPAGNLKSLKTDFINYVNDTIPSPWESTRSILDYVLNHANINLRGDRVDGVTHMIPITGKPQK